jgi:hypothetical protein
MFLPLFEKEGKGRFSEKKIPLIPPFSKGDSKDSALAEE